MVDNKPVSLEVIADDEREMLDQAKILNELSSNVYVKIPIMFTNGIQLWMWWTVWKIY